MERLSPQQLPEVRTYRQHTVSSCGPASLVIAYKAYGVSIKEREIRRDIGTTKDAGAEWEDMALHAMQNGFNVTLCADAKVDDLIEEYLAGHVSIVAYKTPREFTSDYHYSVVSKVDVNQIVLADPAYGDFAYYPTYRFNSFWRDDAKNKAYMSMWWPNERTKS